MDLGARVSSHRIDRPALIVVWYASVAALFGAGSVGTLVAFVGSHDTGLSVTMALLGCVTGVLSYLMARGTLDIWQHRSERIHLHERGVVFEARRATVEHPWSDFVGAAITSVRRYGVEHSRLLDVAFKDGTARRQSGLTEQNALCDVVSRSVPPLSFDPQSIEPRSGGASDASPAVAELGKRLSSHRHEDLRTLIAFASVGFFVMGGMFGVPAVALALSHERGRGFGAVILGLLSVWSASYYAQRTLGYLRRRREVVHAHERGLVFERANGTVDTLKWTDISTAQRYNFELPLKLISGKTELLIGLEAHTALFAFVEARVAEQQRARVVGKK